MRAMSMAKPSSKVLIISLIVVFMCSVTSIGGFFLIRKLSKSTVDSVNTLVDGSEPSQDIDTVTPKDTNSLINYGQDTNTGAVWVASMAEKKFSSDMMMHSTYTFNFHFEVNDKSKSISNVQITDIKATTSLPNGDLKIIPYAHVSRSENGGSIVSTSMYEDWNTYGYTYVTDYSNMKSLVGTYTPKQCTEAIICDYLDEYGQKGGNLSLRFKYVGVGNTITERAEYQAVHVIKAHGIAASQLSGNFTWTLNITLDDGSTDSKVYNVNIDGDSLELDSSNTMFFDF